MSRMALHPMPSASALGTLCQAVVRRWPEHEPYLRQRFGEAGADNAATAELLAERILRICGHDLAKVVDDYRWTCGVMLEEEYHFRRHGRYRHTSFEEVRQLVYDNPDYMRRYAHGLLLSQLLWANHCRAMQAYHESFLSRLPRDATLLEVGPGHGLLLALAAERLTEARITGWDVSDTSLEATRGALTAMRTRNVDLRRQDLLTAPTDQMFDAVVASELVEHLEHPTEALRRLTALTRPGGLLFLNIPVNSPAPDHLALWRSPEALRSLVTDVGLTIEQSHEFPMTGKTVQQARSQNLTISCVLLCRRPTDERPGHA
ncbi:class I SAM-dependent methyltransferase [Micromonospora sp. NPDC049051]|uniref:class I SAM-dependent methyltransferase n=1 Tax=Micromonospora sp. NPDC049051 TaxID=3364264 RepID=UPI003718ADA6